MNVRMWIIVLCGIFLLSIGTLFTANFLISQRVFNDVTMPQITDALRQKYEYGVKSAVEVEAQNLANRLKNVSDKKEQYAIIEQLTDYQRFFPNNEGYYFTYSRTPTGRFLSRNSLKRPRPAAALWNIPLKNPARASSPN